MTNEPRIGNAVRLALNRRMENLSPRVLERLRAARELALSRQRHQQTGRVVALVGGSFDDSGGWSDFALRWLLPVVVLVELPHADGIRMVGNLLGDPTAPVPIGAPVEAVFEHHPDATPRYSLVQWELA